MDDFSDRLRKAGWRIISIRPFREEKTAILPSIIAQRAVPKQGREIGYQIYFRYPTRRGRVGAQTIGHIAENAELLPDWRAVVVSDRGYTERAQEVARGHAPAIVLFDLDEAWAHLSRVVGEEMRSQLGFQWAFTGVQVVGEVALTRLRELAASRAELERIIAEAEPRFLEQLVAENWRREGYRVELVSRSNAGGPDVVAIKEDARIPLKVLTSVKQRTKSNVKPDDVRALYATIDRFDEAHIGMLATNTRLQKGARAFVDQTPRLVAREGRDLVSWTAELWSLPRQLHLETARDVP